MWQYLHPLAYMGVLLSAAVYFYLRERQHGAGFVKRTFWGSSLIYLLSLFFEEGGLLYGLFGILTPDIAYLAAIILILNRFAPRPKVFYFTIFAILAGIKLFFINPTIESLWLGSQAAQAEQTIQLDPTAELLLDIKKHDDLARLQPIISRYDLKLTLAFPEIAHPERTQLDDYYTVDVPEKYIPQLQEIKDALMASGFVDDVEPNEVIQVSPLMPPSAQRPGKPNYGINDPGLEHQWGFEAMQAAEFFAQIREKNIKPKKVAKIAILDTGVEADHEDISANFFSVDAKNDYDKLGHGTHCAGIAAAVSNNGKGIASFAPDETFVRVTSIKVLSDNGYGTQKGVLDGIIKAADSQVDVISMSLGGPSNQERQRAYDQAFDYARKAGAIAVVAAGNSNTDADRFSPANSEGVIAVAAIDPENNRASFSNKVGMLKMGVAAPGVNIYSTFPKGEYKFLNGTSMATPYVAGLLGIMKAIQPELTTEVAFDLLQKTGKDTNQPTETGKLIQAGRLLEAMTQ
ncbi:MAG: S8 family serine peptidase [Bernardetiaceae bacterium]